MVIAVAFALLQQAKTAPSHEERYYRSVAIEAPSDLVLEVSGIALLPDGRPMVSTRRGEVFIVENAYGESEAKPVFKRFAQGLQEPLGLLPRDGWIYVEQRGELSRMRDTD